MMHTDSALPMYTSPSPSPVPLVRNANRAMDHVELTIPHSALDRVVLVAVDSIGFVLRNGGFVGFKYFDHPSN